MHLHPAGAPGFFMPMSDAGNFAKTKPRFHAPAGIVDHCKLQWPAQRKRGAARKSCHCISIGDAPSGIGSCREPHTREIQREASLLFPVLAGINEQFDEPARAGCAIVFDPMLPLDPG